MKTVKDFSRTSAPNAAKEQLLNDSALRLHVGEQAAKRKVQTRSCRHHVPEDDRRLILQVDLGVVTLSDVPSFLVICLPGPLGADECRSMAIPALGIGPRVTQAKIQSATKDVQHHCLLLMIRQAAVDWAKYTRTSSAQRPRI